MALKKGICFGWQPLKNTIKTNKSHNQNHPKKTFWDVLTHLAMRSPFFIITKHPQSTSPPTSDPSPSVLGWFVIQLPAFAADHFATSMLLQSKATVSSTSFYKALLFPRKMLSLKAILERSKNNLKYLNGSFRLLYNLAISAQDLYNSFFVRNTSRQRMAWSLACTLHLLGFMNP